MLGTKSKCMICVRLFLANSPEWSLNCPDIHVVSMTSRHLKMEKTMINPIESSSSFRVLLMKNVKI